jgi:cytochrome bd-type quinol oxidase subunit 1
MRTSHILQFVGLVFFALVLFVQSRKGALKGRPRVAAFVAFGCLALGWVANSFGW